MFYYELTIIRSVLYFNYYETVFHNIQGTLQFWQLKQCKAIVSSNGAELPGTFKLKLFAMTIRNTRIFLNMYTKHSSILSYILMVSDFER